ncbi:hypothetical protein L207DRAFT_328647 [Hyaloscypha variabilis F]|jgi:hypothetical protein|uniref:Uncharacterized protein n=1 Tax=Hyaloscypha variabilis (strain UAMH 11265 / GT02V1 / F) TaxID=1149755 RepID=A0A2J6RSP7_HYAVF|nr:hypothetical protein L207DRAFT_328647 [Hyaloscypha variabilis F]
MITTTACIGMFYLTLVKGVSQEGFLLRGERAPRDPTTEIPTKIILIGALCACALYSVPGTSKYLHKYNVSGPRQSGELEDEKAAIKVVLSPVKLPTTREQGMLNSGP